MEVLVNRQRTCSIRTGLFSIAQVLIIIVCVVLYITSVNSYGYIIPDAEVSTSFSLDKNHTNVNIYLTKHMEIPTILTINHTYIPRNDRVSYLANSPDPANHVTMDNDILSYTTYDIIDMPAMDYIGGLRSACVYVNIQQRRVLSCIPKVILAGFSKCGTTDLFEKMIHHPYLHGPVLKEAHFWDNHKRYPAYTLKKYAASLNFGSSLINECCFKTDEHEFTLQHTLVGDSPFEKNERIHSRYMTEYRTQAKIAVSKQSQALCSRIRQLVKYNETCPITLIDGTPRTVWEGDDWQTEESNLGLDNPSVLAPEKISHVVPNAKIIIILRNPVYRLLSDYKFYYKKAFKSPQHFHNKVLESISWWNKCLNILDKTRCAYGLNYNDTVMPDLRHATWVDTPADRLRIGAYVIYISRWFTVFPRENFLFLRLEDYGVEQIPTLNEKVYPFLNLPPLWNTTKLNKALTVKENSSKKQIKMLKKTYDILVDLYTPYNKALAELLDDDAYLWL